MVFSVDTVQQSINKPLHATLVEEANYDISIFNMTMEAVIKEQREFETNMISLNEGIIGSIAKSAIDKEMSKIKSLDIKEILAKIFDWFCQAIEKVHETFSVFMVKMLNKDVRIKAFKKQLADFQGEVRYNHKYFDYTNILNDNSYANYQNDVSKEYDDLVNKLTDLSAANTPMEIADILTSIKNDIEYTSQDLDILRGKILGLNGAVESGDFAKALFKYFRNDRSEPHNPGLGFSQKNLTTTDVQQAYENYFSFDKQAQIIKRESFKLKGQALAQKVKVRTTKIQDFVAKDAKMNSDIANDYSAIINIKCRKIKDICNIYILYYAAKLDALKEFNIKNRGILIAAIDEIAKRGAKEND